MCSRCAFCLCVCADRNQLSDWVGITSYDLAFLRTLFVGVSPSSFVVSAYVGSYICMCINYCKVYYLLYVGFGLCCVRALIFVVYIWLPFFLAVVSVFFVFVLVVYFEGAHIWWYPPILCCAVCVWLNERMYVWIHGFAVWYHSLRIAVVRRLASLPPILVRAWMLGNVPPSRLPVDRL